jgi:isoquinoline 1-oxidoreductase beta subunit
MTTATDQSRRSFFKRAAAAGGGLMLGFNWLDAGAATAVAESAAPLAGAADAVSFNSYLSISPQGVITLFSPNPEVGQGIKTAFPMIVAEELDVDWKTVNVVQAPLDKARFERQVTGGSGAIPHSWMRLRQAGATARRLMIDAAAARLKVPADQLSTNRGTVVHAASGRKLTYGELAADAALLPVPTDVPLKDPKDFTLIGKSVNNVDNKGIVTGKPLFGIDFYREGMLFAMVQRPPAFGQKLKSVDATAAKAMPGIVDVVTFKNNVAVVGKSTWQVKKGPRSPQNRVGKGGRTGKYPRPQPTVCRPAQQLRGYRAPQGWRCRGGLPERGQRW